MDRLAKNRWYIIGQFISLISIWAFIGFFFPAFLTPGALVSGLFAYMLLYAIGLMFGEEPMDVSNIPLYDRIFLDPSIKPISWFVTVPLFLILGIVVYALIPGVMMFWMSEFFLLLFNLIFLKKYM